MSVEIGKTVVIEKPCPSCGRIHGKLLTAYCAGRLNTGCGAIVTFTLADLAQYLRDEGYTVSIGEPGDF